LIGFHEFSNAFTARFDSMIASLMLHFLQSKCWLVICMGAVMHQHL